MNPQHLFTCSLLASLTLSPVGFADSKDTKESDSEVPSLVIIGDDLSLSKIGGSATVVEETEIQEARAFNINEILRKVPGVLAREEEGFGLRPNIGIRGLNPTRSTKVLLLEDGLPLAYSPYGDNASYYHPTIERFESLEVLKGSAQIAYGPHTVGGVINYITPNPSDDFSGTLRLAAGTDGYLQTYGEVSDTFGESGKSTGILFQFVKKQAEGARENMEFDIQDYNLKLIQELGENHSLTFKATRYEEDSDVPYSGLTLAEYTAAPRQNPFVNDNFSATRSGQSIVHHWQINSDINLSTAVYHSEFHRDWWRQSSNSGQRPNDSSDVNCGSMANLNTTCGNEGRLRDYDVRGVEPRLSISHSLGELKLGARYQEETQDRLQINSDTPKGRTPGTSTNGGVREDNERDTQAKSWFIENSFSVADWTITPGVRQENIDYQRINHLNNAEGDTSLTETLAGLGVTYKLSGNTVLFGGVHEGFSPPRVEDIISNTDGASVDLDAEKSLNSELGIRYDNKDNFKLEASIFLLDFENQIVPASVAGGTGATLTSAGETKHAGVELLTHYEWFADNQFNPFTNLSWTWVSDAEYQGTRTSSITAGVDVSGNRLPYSPEHSLSLVNGFEMDNGLRAQFEIVYLDSQYTDDLNTKTVTANGQRGLIDSYTVYNLSINYTIPDTDITVFIAGKNLTDKLYVVDMSRGLIPGMQRSWQSGIEWKF